MAEYFATISTDGSGDGTNISATTPIGKPLWNADFYGALMGVRVDDNGADAGVDVTLSEPYGEQRTILAVTNVASDTTYNPTRLMQDTAGADGTQRTHFLVRSNNLKVTVAQGGATITDAIKVIVDILEA